MNWTTRLLLLVLCSFTGLAIGLFFAKRLKSKYEFYDELNSFIDSLVSDITFRQDGGRIVAMNFSNGCKSRLKYVLENYCLSPERVPSIEFLPKSERQTVLDFFAGLGKFDILTEKSELENMRAKISTLCVQYKEKCDKKYGMYLKLGLLFGLAAGILIL